MLRQLHSTEGFLWKKFLTDNFQFMAKIKLKQFKSSSGMPERQRRTLAALGFKRLNQVVELENTAQIQGMYNKLKHLLTVVN